MRIGWCFTAKPRLAEQHVPDGTEYERNLFEEEVWDLISDLIEYCNAYAFQLEVAPTTGYQHFQGYFELNNKNRFSWIQNHIRKFEFLQERKGSPQQAWSYATKLETRLAGPFTHGEVTVADKGEQKRLELFLKDVRSGHDDEKLMESHPSCWIRYPKAIDRVRSIQLPVRTCKLEVYLFFGPPGTGKTDFAYDQGMKLGYVPYELPIGKDFWVTPTMYNKKYIIIDEFKANLALKDLLKVLDKRPIEAPLKGGFAWWMPDIIVVTTNISPWYWYPYNNRDFEREALFRRFTGAYSFAKNPEMVPSPQGIDLNDQAAFDALIPTTGRTSVRHFPLFVPQNNGQHSSMVSNGRHTSQNVVDKLMPPKETVIERYKRLKAQAWLDANVPVIDGQ